MSLQEGDTQLRDAPAPDTTPPLAGGATEAPERTERAEPAERTERRPLGTEAQPSGKSVRQLLQEEFAKAREETEPTPQSRNEPDGTPPAKGAAPEDRPRTPDGKFAPSTREPAAPTAAAAPEPVSPTPTPAKAAAPEPPVTRAPPGGWSAEAKQQFVSLPPAVQEAVIKREAEVSEGFKGKSEETKKLQDRLAAAEPLLKAFEPHSPWFKQNGRTDAEVATQMLSWLHGLAHADPAQRMRSYRALGESFGIPTTQQPAAPTAPVAPATPPASGTPTPSPTADIEARVKAMVDQALQPVHQSLQQQTNQQIIDHITSWSTDKPFYERVKGRMAQLIGNGIVPPLPNGKADLDTAYHQATWSDPDIRKELQAAELKTVQDAADQKARELEAAAAKVAEEARLAQEAKAKADAEAKARADAASHRRDHATQARQAGVSVGTRAPTAAPAPPARQAKNAPPREIPSVRDRLLESMRQLSG